jgi:alanine racemase
LIGDHPETYLNAVDPGKMLYGPSRGAPRADAQLRPAFIALKTRLITVKDLTPRELFAAEAPFPITAGLRLGVIPIGAADGMLELHAGRVLVRGHEAPILAGPSLEHTRVDLTAIPDAAIGDEVVIIGRQGDRSITVDEIAELHRRAAMNVPMAVGPRITRVYMAGGAVVKQVAPA